MAKASFYENSPTPPGSPPPQAPGVTSTTPTDAPSSFYKGGSTPPVVQLQGVSPFVAIPHNWITGLDNLGAFTYAQPAFSDLSGTIAAAQITAGLVTNAMLANSSVTIAGHVVSLGGSQTLSFSDLLGQATNAQLQNSSVTISGHVLSLGGILSLASGDISGLGYFATGTDASNLTGTLNNARLSAVPNSALANSSITIAGHVVSLGGSQALSFSDIGGVASNAQIPAPTLLALGGVEAVNAVAHQWINSISTLGVPSLSQPAFSDISGTIASAQVSGAYTGITQVGTLTAGAIGAGFTAIPNSALANSSVTISGHALALGGTLSLASGDISGLGTFATQNYATPPAIGGTTPNTGAFSSGAVGGNYLTATIPNTTNVSQFYSLLTTGNGYGVLGGGRMSDAGVTAGANIFGVGAFALADSNVSTQTATAFYSRLQVTGSQTAIAGEINIVAQTGASLVSVTPYSIPNLVTAAAWLSSGDPGFTANKADAAVALGIINNSSGFSSGIVFGSGSITASGGFSEALKLPANYRLGYYVSGTTTPMASINSSISSGASPVQALTFTDTGVTLTGSVTSTSTTTGTLAITGGLGVSGAIHAGSYGIGTTPFASVSGVYNILNEQGGANAIIIGSSVGDPSTYYKNTQHQFQSLSGTAWLTLNNSAATFSIPVLASNIGMLAVTVTGISLAATGDTAFAITLPAAFANYTVNTAEIRNSGSVASLTTAQVALYTGAGGTGTAIFGPSALSAITSNAANTTGNMAQIAGSSSIALNLSTLYFRCTTIQGAGAAVDVVLNLRPMP